MFIMLRKVQGILNSSAAYWDVGQILIQGSVPLTTLPPNYGGLDSSWDCTTDLYAGSIMYGDFVV